MAMFTPSNQFPSSLSQAQHGSDYQREDKWTYLIANNITFTPSVSGAIRLTKPHNDTLLVWLEKIVKGGQCARIFVENLQLGNAQLAGITALCLAYGVELHSVNGHSTTENAFS